MSDGKMKVNMENKIIFYNQGGSINTKEELSEESLKKTNGMMVRCTLKNGVKEEGLCDPYHIAENNCNNTIRDYILLCNWKNLNEKTHELMGDNETKFEQIYKKLKINDILYIEAILYSNPRWSGRFTNRFVFFEKRFKRKKSKY